MNNRPFNLGIDPLDAQARLQSLMQPAQFARGGSVPGYAEGGLMERLRNLLKGDDYQSQGGKTVRDGEVNWGNEDSAADFFRADKARMALDKGRRSVANIERASAAPLPPRRPMPEAAPAPDRSDPLRTIPGAFPPMQSEQFEPFPGALNRIAKQPEKPMPYSRWPVRNDKYLDVNDWTPAEVLGLMRAKRSMGETVTGYAKGGRKDKDDPSQWLQLGGQDMEAAPAGLPIGQAAGTSMGYHALESLGEGAEMTKRAIEEGLSPDMSDPEVVRKVFGAAGLVSAGGIGVPARAGEAVLGAGPVMKIEAAVPTRKLTLRDVRREFDPRAGENMSEDEIARLVNAYERVASPASEHPDLAARGREIADTYITKGGSESGGRSYFNHKPSVPLEELGRVAEPIPYTHEPKAVVDKSWQEVGRERAGSPLISLGGDLSDLVRLRGYGPKEDLRALANATDIHAGFDYMLEPNRHSVWSNNPEHAAMLEKQILKQKEIQRAIDKDLPVMAIANPMGPRAIDSAKNMMDLYLNAIEASPIQKVHLDAVTKDIREGKFGKSPKEKATLKEKLGDFPGFDDMDAARKFLLDNPDVAGTTRAAIIKGLERADLVKKGFPEVGQLRVAATSPKFMMAPGNTMGGRMVELDPRMFHQAEANRYFDHYTYGGDSPGIYYADVPLIQRQYGAPDVTDMLLAKYNVERPNPKNPDKPKAPISVHPFSTDQSGRDTWRKMFEEQRMVQPINERMLESIQRGESRRGLYGFAEGGEVEGYATGGPADDPIEALYNKYTGHGSDAAGKAWWQQQTAGMTPEEQDAAFLKGTNAAYAANAAAPGPVTDAQIQNLYQQYAGREADQGGLEYWKQKAAAPGATYAGLSNQFRQDVASAGGQDQLQTVKAPAWLEKFDYENFDNPLDAGLDYLKRTLGDKAAAALYGNFNTESYSNPQQLQLNRKGQPIFDRLTNMPLGMGLAQWDPERQNKLYQFADKYGVDPNSTEGQLRFVVNNFATNPKLAKWLERIQNPNTNLPDATQIVQNKYEIPRDKQITLAARRADADMLLRYMNKGTMTPAEQAKIAGIQGKMQDPLFAAKLKEKQDLIAKNAAAEKAKLAGTTDILGDTGFNQVVDTSVNDQIMQQSNDYLNQSLQNNLNSSFVDANNFNTGLGPYNMNMSFSSSGAQGNSQFPGVSDFSVGVMPNLPDWFNPSPFAEGGSVGYAEGGSFQPMFEGDSEMLQMRAKQLAKQAYSNPRSLSSEDMKEWNLLAGRYNLPFSSQTPMSYEDEMEQRNTALERNMSAKERRRTYAQGGSVDAYDPAEIDAIAAQIRGAA